ncbi:hypothetical protein PDESU_05239 [Pontiella desulfatans]|uniref:Outer membrane protein beta-barrel domain-containing protein n=1 Tax=Pontiella desulfatans TaxID=2750659 RepID=A0A6C2U967_PONDE|nr:porin family protein [Pontiella desulfatans]VGO16648.1 hypothetical protein PDESU_05239 [Pontiella desulfatans]
MKKILVLGCVLHVLIMADTALAGKKSGLYLGGSIGAAALNVSTQSVDFDGDDLGYKIFGGYNFGIIPLIDIGVEGSYVDFGSASDAEILNQEIGVTAWDLFAVGALNLGPVGLFGKMGPAWWKSESDYLQSYLDETGTDLVYGIGLRFQISSVAVRAEYERFDMKYVDVDYISLGASWTF